MLENYRLARRHLEKYSRTWFHICWNVLLIWMVRQIKIYKYVVKGYTCWQMWNFYDLWNTCNWYNYWNMLNVISMRKVPVIRCKTWAGNKDMIQYLSSYASHGQGTKMRYSTQRHVQDMDREQRKTERWYSIMVIYRMFKWSWLYLHAWQRYIDKLLYS